MNIIRKRTYTLFFLMVIFILSGCGKKEQSENMEQTGIRSSGNVAPVTAVEHRTDKASNFSWNDESGKTVDLDSYRGKVTLINFWATWCGPCKAELPDLVDLSKRFASRNVKFIGVSVDQGSDIIADVRDFVKKEGVPYQNVLATDELVTAYGNVRAIPSSFLIDSDGKIVQKFVGMRSKQFLADAIEVLLK